MNKDLIITIGRQFGSGGHEIGTRLAKKLGIAFYDKEILKTAAKESGIVEELFERADEQPTNSFLYSLSMGSPSHALSFTGYGDYLTNDKLFVYQANAIKELAAKGPCVIIGRCADYILRDNPNLISVFIHADFDYRLGRKMEFEGLSEAAARAAIKKTDKKRASYYNFYSDANWGLAENYHLSLDSGRLGIDHSVELLESYIRIADCL